MSSPAVDSPLAGSAQSNASPWLAPSIWFAKSARAAQLSSHAARWLERGRHWLRHATRRAVPAPVAMLELLSAGWLCQAVVAAAQLGLADAMGDAPTTATRLAQQLGLSADATERLLRALAEQGVFARHSDGRFGPSALSETLRSDHPSSIRDFALFVGSADHREHWSALQHSVTSGVSSIAMLRGQAFFEFARDTPEFGALFSRAMTNLSALSRDYLLAAYEFSGFSSMVDVGGGEGRLLSAILERTPALQGVVFDLPEVIARAPAPPASVATRLDYMEGSFFDAWPTGHHAYLLKHILHDWDDEPARRILARAREALMRRPDAKLLLIEMVLPSAGEPHMGTLFDLEMLLSVGGRERTRADFAALLKSAGLRLERVHATASPLSILEARLG